MVVALLRPVSVVVRWRGWFCGWNSSSIRFGLMAQVGRRSDGFGRELVLGLLAEEPANCYQLDRRLAKRFGSAGYTNGTARQAIMRLIDEKLVRVVDDGQRVAPASRLGARATVYEATPRGIEH